MNGNVHHKFLPQAEIMNQHFCADVLHLQLSAKITWKLVHQKLVAPPWQHCHSFCSVCANFPANKATTVAPQPSGSRVSLHIFYFLKLNLAVKGRIFHDISMIKNSCKLSSITFYYQALLLSYVWRNASGKPNTVPQLYNIHCTLEVHRCVQNINNSSHFPDLWTNYWEKYNISK
jgi:hypothetical protein